MNTDLLNPSPESEIRKHKLKRLVQGPNSFYMDVLCPDCAAITVVYSHATTQVVCAECGQVLCNPTGGRAKLVQGTHFRPKAN
ncbi:ribosomal protein S27e [Kipferlia bialata]|uniref:Ribosomal protein S27e n=1 Tax=Kipferlia bialata TaxID=797122 RepID=A0A9K3CTZ6_9EUKA|nr:ribosomal protein S27e [Kipferlia bialata]|eukprot:g4418.t1